MYTEEQIILGNKKIAKFMGLVYKNSMFSDKSFCSGYYTPSSDKMIAMLDSHLNFHISWDSLISVITEIKKLNNEKKIFEKNIFESKVQTLKIDDGILTAWGVVIDYIDWVKKEHKIEKIENEKPSFFLITKK